MDTWKGIGIKSNHQGGSFWSICTSGVTPLTPPWLVLTPWMVLEMDQINHTGQSKKLCLVILWSLSGSILVHSWSTLVRLMNDLTTLHDWFWLLSPFRCPLNHNNHIDHCGFILITFFGQWLVTIKAYFHPFWSTLVYSMGNPTTSPTPPMTNSNSYPAEGAIWMTIGLYQPLATTLLLCHARVMIGWPFCSILVHPMGHPTTPLTPLMADFYS